MSTASLTAGPGALTAIGVKTAISADLSPHGTVAGQAPSATVTGLLGTTGYLLDEAGGLIYDETGVGIITAELVIFLTGTRQHGTVTGLAKSSTVT